MNTVVKRHLQLVEGAGTQPDRAPSEDQFVSQSRIRLATIFIDPKARQHYINNEVVNFWRHSEVAIEQVLKLHTGAKEDDSMMPLIQNIRKAFTTSCLLPTNARLEQLLDKVAILALHCLRQLRARTRNLKTDAYEKSSTSQDFYQYDPASGKNTLKPTDKLSNIISSKNFELDTSEFEKEVAIASTMAIHYRLRSLAPDIPESVFQRYLLSIFTAFNQRKYL